MINFTGRADIEATLKAIENPPLEKWRALTLDEQVAVWARYRALADALSDQPTKGDW